VLAFELAAGVPPFMHEDRMVMYRRIVDGVYTCPAHFSAVSNSLARCRHGMIELQQCPPGMTLHLGLFLLCHSVNAAPLPCLELGASRHKQPYRARGGEAC
jgi:hypothetical protein